MNRNVTWNLGLGLKWFESQPENGWMGKWAGYSHIRYESKMEFVWKYTKTERGLLWLLPRTLRRYYIHHQTPKKDSSLLEKPYCSIYCHNFCIHSHAPHPGNFTYTKVSCYFSAISTSNCFEPKRSSKIFPSILFTCLVLFYHFLCSCSFHPCHFHCQCFVSQEPLFHKQDTQDHRELAQLCREGC